MNKQQFIDAVSALANTTKVDTSNVLDAITTVTQEELLEGNEVTFHGLGTFKVSPRKARTGHHPRTRAPIEIQASKAVSFSVAPKLKKSVNA